MNPALKLYLDKLHAETRAQYAEIHKQLQLQEALFSKFDTGASTPQPARSAVVASNGGLTIDATVMAVVPVLAALDASAKPLDIDATGVAAQAPTICSTDGLNRTADGDDPTAVCQTAWSTPTSFIVPPGDSPTPSREPALGLALGALAHTKYSTEGSEVSANSIVRASMSGVARSAAVTTVLLVDILLDTAESHEVVPDITNSNGLREELRPRPWPSFNCSQEGMHLKHAKPLPQATYAMKHFYGDLTCLREFLRYLQIMQSKPCTDEKVACWISPAPRAICQQLLGSAGTELQPRPWPMHEVNQGNVRLKLPWPSSCNYRSVQVWSTLPQATELAFCIVHQRVLQAVGKFWELILIVTTQNRGSKISSVSVILPLMHGIDTCSLENILVLTWRSIGLSVEQLSEATYSCAVSLYVASRQWIISWLEGSSGLTTTHSSLQGEQITCSYPKPVTTQLLVSAETECLDSLLLIPAYLGGSCGLKWDINITLLHASKWSSSLHYEKLCNPSSFWSESTLYIDQFKDLLCHMDILLACMSGQQPIVLLPGHWFVPGMEHLQVLQDTSGFPWYYYLGTLKYSCYCLATEDTTGFPASCSDWMSEIKNLVSYGVQEYTVNDFPERHLCGPAASYFVLINFWAMGTGYLQILQQIGNIELKENQINNNIDEQWPGQLVFLSSISDVMAYCFMPDSHSVGLVFSSVICEVVVPPVQYVPRLLCMQPITHKNEATSTLLMGLSAWGVPWDPGDLRIVFQDIHGERNPHFVRQILLTIPCSSLMDGVEFSTSCGQAPFQGGRNFMILAAFVDHNYYLNAVLNLVPASHDDYRDPVRVNSGHGCDYEGYLGNPGKQAYYFGRVYTDLHYYHEDYHGDPSKIKELQAPWDPGKSAPTSPKIVSTPTISPATPSIVSPAGTTTTTSLESTLTSATTAPSTKSRSIECNGIRVVLGGVGLGSSRVSRREGC